MKHINVQYFIYYRDTRNYNIQQKIVSFDSKNKLMQAQQQQHKIMLLKCIFNSPPFRNINSMKNIKHRRRKKNGKLRNSKNIHAQCQSFKNEYTHTHVR